MSIVRRLIPLTLGWERLPKSYSVHGDTSGEILTEPVPAVLLDTDVGPMLLDTGINSAIVRDPWLYERFHGRNHDIVPILPAGDGEPLQTLLAANGVALTDIVAIHLSHLHNDHSGGLRLFANRVPVTVQRREYEYGMSGHPFPEQHGMFRLDYDDPGIPWTLLDGDTELAPGIKTVLTPGHTPGHASFLITLQNASGYILPFDAGDLTENFEHERGPGGYVHCTAEQARQPILRLKALSAATGYPIVPGHCPDAWPAFTGTGGTEHG